VATLLDDILSALGPRVADRKANGEIAIWCPFHPDGEGSPPHNPNLAIKPGTKGAAYVWACPVCNIGGTLLQLAERLREIGMMQPREKADEKIVKTYPYCDEEGRPLFEVLRFANKRFSQRRPDGKDGWIWNLDGVRRVPYRLPELLAADPAEWVHVVEGEKDANNLSLLGLVATTNPGGAGKWRSEFAPYFKGRRVAILPDNDDPGQAHAQDVAHKLAPHAADVRIVVLPGLSPGGDATDWVKDGHTAEELRVLVDAAPPWEDSPPSVSRPDTGKSAPNADAEPVAVLVSLADVQPESVHWLWSSRIPLGKLTILAGPPGAGKSYALLDIAARVSQGASLPDGAAAPLGDVVLLTAEDGLGDTVRPRLDLLGAESGRVHALTMVRQGESERMFSLEDHLPLLERAIIEKGACLAIIDPLLAYTGRADSYKEAEVRGLLAPVAVMAERTGCAVVAIVHLNKRGGEHSPLNRITASVAFVAQARSVLLLAIDPQDDNGQRRILAPVKMNLCAHPPSLALHFGDDGGLFWDGPVATNAADLLAVPMDDGERGSLAEAQEFLRDLLRGGPVEAEEVLKRARRAGVAEKTLRRAKAALRVISERQGGLADEGYWAWVLPNMAIPTNIGSVAILGEPDTKSKPPEGKVGHLSGAAPADLGAGDADAIPPEFTGQRHLVVALGLELDFPNVTWPGGGIPAGRHWYEQAARYFSDADIEKAVAILEATAAGSGSDA